jgi:hypothetical protein
VIVLVSSILRVIDLDSHFNRGRRNGSHKREPPVIECLEAYVVRGVMEVSRSSSTCIVCCYQGTSDSDILARGVLNNGHGVCTSWIGKASTGKAVLLDI